MNNDEAKFILSAYRPGGEDASDARFAEALAQAERDPELTAWFEDARHFDGALSEAVQTIPLPPELRASIVAGGKISRPRWSPTRRNFLALAAGIVLLAALAGVWFQQRAPQLALWQRDALAFIEVLGRDEASFDMQNKDVAVLQDWLQAQHAPAPASLPAALRNMPSLGCKTIDSAGRAVTIICFKMETGEVIHLAVTNPESSARTQATAPRFVEEDGWRTASWTESDHAYMLATKASEDALRAVVSNWKTTARVRVVTPLVALSAIRR